MRKPGHQYADDYPDPLTGHPLQTYPIKELEEFDSVEDWAAYQDAVARKSRHVGIRLTESDFAELDALARGHGVPAGTMARILIVRALRAAADRR